MIDHHAFFDIAQLARVIVRTAEIIAIPTIRYRGAVNAVVGEQRILAEKFTETFAVPVPAPCRADPTATASVFVEIEKAATFKKSRLCNTRVFNFSFAPKNVVAAVNFSPFSLMRRFELIHTVLFGVWHLQ